MGSPCLNLEIADKLSNMVSIYLAHISGEVITFQKIVESIKKASVPLNCFGTFALGLAGELKALDEVLQI